LFFIEDNAFHVRDEASLNGVYIRIHGEMELEAGDRFMVGEQLFELVHIKSAAQTVDDELTHFFGSAAQNAQWRIQQILDGGQDGLSRYVRTNPLSIGRGGCEIDFPTDRFISGRHCFVEVRDTRVILTDDGSRNGTYVKLKSTHQLSDGDHLFIGKQLLRVELSGEGR